MKESRLILRVFAEASDASVAGEIRDRIAPILEALCIIQKNEIEKYWKIEEYFEISFWLAPHIDPQQAFSFLLEQSPEGWSFYDDLPSRNAVWNKFGNNLFLGHEVRWAELILDLHENERTTESISE